jgi:hypothetical protein
MANPYPELPNSEPIQVTTLGIPSVNHDEPPRGLSVGTEFGNTRKFLVPQPPWLRLNLNTGIPTVFFINSTENR